MPKNEGHVKDMFCHFEMQRTHATDSTLTREHSAHCDVPSAATWRHRLLIQDVSPCDLQLERIEDEVHRSHRTQVTGHSLVWRLFIGSLCVEIFPVRCPVHMGAQLPFYFLFISKSGAHSLFIQFISSLSLFFLAVTTDQDCLDDLRCSRGWKIWSKRLAQFRTSKGLWPTP